MGTTTKTDQSSKFDPTSMNSFQGMTKSMTPVLQGFMQNPFGNPFFQQQQQMGTRQAQNMGQTNMNQLFQNQNASGFGGGSQNPFMQEMMANQMRANSGMQAQLGFSNPVQSAQGMQQNALGIAAGYRPLQTGGTTTQSTGGLGTWLPQLAGGALGALTGGMLGGFGGSGGGGGGAPSWYSGGGNPGSQMPGFYSGAGNNPTGFGSGASGFNMGNSVPSWMGGMSGGGGLFGSGGQPGMPGGGVPPWNPQGV